MQAYHTGLLYGVKLSTLGTASPRDGVLYKATSHNGAQTLRLSWRESLAHHQDHRCSRSDGCCHNPCQPTHDFLLYLSVPAMEWRM